MVWPTRPFTPGNGEPQGESSSHSVMGGAQAKSLEGIGGSLRAEQYSDNERSRYRDTRL